MAKKILESSGVGRSGAKKSPAKKKAAAKKVIPEIVGNALFPIPNPAPKWLVEAVVAGKVPLEEIEKERKAIEKRGLVAKRICISAYNKRPRKRKEDLDEDGRRTILGYRRPDGLYVSAILGDSEDDIPPERRSPYGIFKSPPPPGGYLKILDKKLLKKVMKWNGI